jgi:hypothetical protein
MLLNIKGKSKKLVSVFYLRLINDLILDVEQKAADKVQEVSYRVLSLRLFNGVE